jgi:hypothetical protein
MPTAAAPWGLGLTLDALLAPNADDPSAAPTGMSRLVEHVVQLMDKWHALVGTQVCIHARMQAAAQGSLMKQLRDSLVDLAPASTIRHIIDKISHAPDDTPLVLAVPLHANQLKHDVNKYHHCDALRECCQKELSTYYMMLRSMLEQKRVCNVADLKPLVAQARARVSSRVETYCDCVQTHTSAGATERTLSDVWLAALDVLPVPYQQRSLTWFLRRGLGTPLPVEFPLWLGSAVNAHQQRKRLRDDILRVTGLDAITTVGELKRAHTGLVAAYKFELEHWLFTKRALDAFEDRSLPALQASGLPLPVVEEWLPVAHVGDDLCDTCSLPMGWETTGATTCAFCPPRPAAPADRMEISPPDDDTVIPPPQFLSQQ